MTTTTEGSRSFEEALTLAYEHIVRLTLHLEPRTHPRLFSTTDLMRALLERKPEEA